MTLKISLIIYYFSFFHLSIHQEPQLFKQSGRIEILGDVIKIDNNFSQLQKNTSWIYMSINIPGLSTGTINVQKNDGIIIFNKIVVSRQDISVIFIKYYDLDLHSFNIASMCDEVNKLTKTATDTGDMSLYVFCYYNDTKNIDIKDSPNFTAPINSQPIVQCGNLMNSCSEGYCAMFEREVYSFKSNAFSQIQNYYCPNDLFNLLYFERANTLFVTSYETSITNAFKICINKSNFNVTIEFGVYSFFWWINCYVPSPGVTEEFYPMPNFSEYILSTEQPEVDYTDAIQTNSKTLNNKIYLTTDSICKSFGELEILGEIINFDNDIVYCGGNIDRCAFISLDIPGLAIGTFNGCQSEVNRVINQLANERNDVADNFLEFYNFTTHNFQVSYLCENYNDKNFIKNSMTGNFTIYIYCYNKNDGIPDSNNSPNFTSPKHSANPVSCEGKNNTQINCTQGYCGMYEREVYSIDNCTLKKERYQDCPNDLINQIYSDYSNGMLNSHYRFSIKDIPTICIKQNSSNETFVNEYNSYFWWINCFVPNNLTRIEFPSFPTLYIDNRSITISTTTSKNSKCKDNYTPILLYLSLFVVYFISDII
uniref:EGF-like domain-containing protein n=1 Tax=Parastrongyloides trichosuri TaxID=131310 RepID=A0A0N4ZDM9_PARTI